jgi:hypothetical protein
MMNNTMSQPEVKLAMRIIGLRGTSMKARGNGWNYRFHNDREPLMALQNKGHVLGIGPASRWMLTRQGIQQLKQQIGEFTFY